MAENILQEEEKPLFGSLQNRQVGSCKSKSVTKCISVCLCISEATLHFSSQVWKPLSSSQLFRDWSALRLLFRATSVKCWQVCGWLRPYLRALCLIWALVCHEHSFLSNISSLDITPAPSSTSFHSPAAGHSQRAHAFCFGCRFLPPPGTSIAGIPFQMYNCALLPCTFARL